MGDDDEIPFEDVEVATFSIWQLAEVIDDPALGNQLGPNPRVRFEYLLQGLAFDLAKALQAEAAVTPMPPHLMSHWTADARADFVRAWYLQKELEDAEVREDQALLYGTDQLF